MTIIVATFQVLSYAYVLSSVSTMRRVRWLRLSVLAISASLVYLFTIFIIAQDLFQDAYSDRNSFTVKRLSSQLRSAQSRLASSRVNVAFDANDFLWIQPLNASSWKAVGRDWSQVLQQVRVVLHDDAERESTTFANIARSIAQSRKRLTIVLKDVATFAQLARDHDVLGLFLRWPKNNLLSADDPRELLLQSEVKR